MPPERRRRRANGEGSIYQRASDGLWVGMAYVYTTTGIRKRRPVYGHSRDEVRDKLDRLQGDSANGIAVPDRSVTVAEYLKHWLARVKEEKRATTHRGYESAVRLHITPVLGSKRLEKLTGADVRRLIAVCFQALCKRYERAWAEPLRGPWKKEFQGRGAPHFHISTTPPMGTTIVPDPATGQPIRVDFKRWLSITWADIVGHPDDEQRRRHLAAGTGVDYAQGIKLTDPRRMAVYFAKYGAAATGKEYQHQVPREWLTTVLVCTACGTGYEQDRDECPDCGCPDADVIEDGSVGRFWGYRGLRRELAIRQVTPDIGIAAGRIARRWYRAKGLTKTVRVQRVEQATGRVTYRRSTVRRRLFAHGRGFLCVNDGAEFASQLARYLASLTEQ